LTDFLQQASFFFKSPETIDVAAIRPKWTEQKRLFFIELIRAFQFLQEWEHDMVEKELKEMAAAHHIKPGELMLPLRIMLVGGKFGPGVFDIAVTIGKEETVKRIKHALELLQE
jgi:glutamyl-tRNA synthetase